MTEKRFHYDYKTGRMKDTQSNSQATKDMRVLETIINDACYSYEKKIKELESCNHSLAQKQQRKLTKIIELEKENKQLQIEVLGQSEEIEILSDENTRLKQGKYVYGIHGGSND